MIPKANLHKVLAHPREVLHAKLAPWQVYAKLTYGVRLSHWYLGDPWAKRMYFAAVTGRDPSDRRAIVYGFGNTKAAPPFAIIDPSNQTGCVLVTRGGGVIEVPDENPFAAPSTTECNRHFEHFKEALTILD